MFDWALILAEVNVPGHHYLQSESRDLILMALSYISRRDRWHSDGVPLTDSQWDALDNALARASEDVIVQVNTSPVATIEWYAGLDPLPDGWLLCDGTIYNATDYPLLFDRLGATYGGNGTTTFAVPFIDERFIRATQLEAELGDEAGSDTVTLTANELPAHTHGYGYPSVGVDLETPGVPDITAVANPPSTLQTSSAGSGQPFSVTNPYIKFRPIIRARGDGMVQLESPGGGGFVVGEVRYFAFGTVPANWLACDGAGYDTTTYAALFAAIGYAYGGSGATFQVPSLKGRVPVGLDAADADFDAIADAGGEKTHVLTTNEMPAHSHGRQSFGTTTTTGTGLRVYGAQAAGIQSANTGGGAAHNNMPPYLTLLPCIRYAP